MTVIPDSIEPLVLWRSWDYVDGVLVSPLNRWVKWLPGEPVRATCDRTGYAWRFVRSHGMTRDEAATYYAESLEQARKYVEQGLMGYSLGVPAPPQTIHPRGYGLWLQSVPAHQSPDEACACGIYGVTERHNILGIAYGDRRIVGTVSLWGKIVPGEDGARGQYAYPASLIVPPSFADDEGLLAYGVPLIVEEPIQSTARNPVAGPSLLAYGASCFAAGVSLTELCRMLST